MAGVERGGALDHERRPSIEATKAERPAHADPRAGNEVERDLLLARVAKSLLGESTAPTRIGRFTIIDELGRGAMGVVFRAFDPKLDRKVAIKLVAGGAPGTEADHAQALLEREARAAADLNHPNVVTVYDVGRHNGRIFLAMEFVDGATLRDWIDDQAPSWAEVLDIFEQVGRGLAAAHAAGIVHRDFKPDNVMVGKDGRPRVADFGLARPFEAQTDDTDAPAAARRTDGDLSASPGGTTGAICGTPGYMAPEQFAGLGATPASDQFAFCVALYEALFGSRPFIADSLTGLATRVMEGEREALPNKHAVPRAALAAINRGLDSDPTERHASMSALVERLSEIRLGPRRRRLVGIGGTLAALALGAGVAGTLALDDEPCEDTSEEIEAVWPETRQQRLRTRYGQDGALIDRLNDYAASWSASSLEACTATAQDGRQSEHALQLRVSCFSRAANRFDGVVGALETGERSDTGLVRIDDALVPIETCADVDALDRLSNRFATSSAHEVDANPALIAELQRRVGHVLMRVQTETDAGAAAQELNEFVEKNGLHDARPVARLLLGQALGSVADPNTLLGHFDASLQYALEAGDLEAAAQASLARALTLVKTGRTDLAEAELLHLEGYAASAVLAENTIRFRMQKLRGRMARARGHMTAAREHYESALALEGSTTIEPTMIASARVGLGLALDGLGLRDEAYNEYKLALSIDSSEGTTNAHTQNNMGHNRTNVGDYRAAEIHFKRAQAMIGKAAGEDSLPFAQALGSRGWLARIRGNFDEGLALHERSLAIREAAVGKDAVSLTYPLDELAQIALAQGKPEDALAFAGRARSIFEATDVSNPRYAVMSVAYGEAQLELGEREAARKTLETALTKLESVEGKDDEVARARAALAKLAPANPAEH